MKAARTLTHDGLTLTINQWAEQTGLTPSAIYWRLSQGWTVEQTLTIERWKHRRMPSLETEFFKLVCSIDGALQVFRKRIGSYEFEEADRGVVEAFSKSRRDRCPRVAQDRA